LCHANLQNLILLKESSLYKFHIFCIRLYLFVNNVFTALIIHNLTTTKYILYKTVMAGEKGTKEKGKKAPEKTLKEKRAAKEAKKKEKNSSSSL